jgi:hypothetical protein
MNERARPLGLAPRSLLGAKKPTGHSSSKIRRSVVLLDLSSLGEVGAGAGPVEGGNAAAPLGEFRFTSCVLLPLFTLEFRYSLWLVALFQFRLASYAGVNYCARANSALR